MTDEENGHRVLPGVKGDDGPEGPRGREGKAAELPGGAFRLTDRRLLVIYLLIGVSVLLMYGAQYRSDQDIKRENYDTCVAFRAIVTDITADRPTSLELPNCERLRP